MSSFQTSLSTMRQRSAGSPWVILLAGLILGLLLGLFVGWVIWPVEWEGAYLRDLVPEARAEYVAAVADRYFAYGSEAALQEARQSLANVQGDALLEIQSAMEYYMAHPNPQNEIRRHNLAQLANALGGQANPALAQVVVPATSELAASVPANNEVLVPTATTAANVAVGTSVNEASNQSSWLSTLFTLFAGVLLLGGGLYLLQRLRQGGDGLFATGSGPRVVGGRNSIDDDYSFDDEPDDEQSAPSPARTAKTPWLDDDVARRQPAVPPARQSPWNKPIEEETFEDESDDEESDDDAASWQNPRSTSSSSSSATTRLPRSDFRWQDESDERFAEDGERTYDDLNSDDMEDADEQDDNSARYGRPMQTTSTTSDRYRKPFEDDADDELNESEDDDDLPDGNSSAASRALPPLARHRNLDDRTQSYSEPRSQPARPGSAPLARPSGAKNVGSFDCVYMAGMSDYDESFNIANPLTKTYIGECGMGVSTKNRILHKNPDEVIALEVWLFDKADGSSLSTQMRVLMSEYASDRYADVFSKERNGEARPFVPQPGVKFQLEGPTLILNGEVIDVDYTREGVFQNVKVHMDVLRR